jgi:hypothetical protein
MCTYLRYHKIQRRDFRAPPRGMQHISAVQKLSKSVIHETPNWYEFEKLVGRSPLIA